MSNIEEIARRFDLEQSDHYKEPIDIPDLDANKVLLIGTSGSGKSTILQHYMRKYNYKPVDYDTRPICDYFNTPDEAQQHLKSAGLNAVPTWVRPLHTLSDGEKFRAKLAIEAYNNEIFFIDEFTSSLDRTTAKSICASINKGMFMKNFIFATGHEDVVKWLEVDMIYNTDYLTFAKEEAEPIKASLDIQRVDYHFWEWFKKHHYLMGNINKSSHCYVTYMGNKMAGFIAVNNQIGRDTPNSKREHRLVILPQYQGRGIGSLFSNTIAYLYVKQGYRYFSKTSNVLLGEYRQRSELWKPTATNLKQRVQNSPSGFENWNVNTTRISYSHEFIGQNIPKFEEIIEQQFDIE